MFVPYFSNISWKLLKLSYISDLTTRHVFISVRSIFEFKVENSNMLTIYGVNFYEWLNLITLIFEALYFLKLCPIFVSSVAAQPFFSKFVSRANNSNIYRPKLSRENKKCSPWKVFGINHPQTLQLFAEKSFLAWQKSSCTFSTTLEVVIWKNHVAKPLD